MTFMSRGQDYLNRTKAAADGFPVAYSRGAQSVTVTAWLGQTAFAQQPTKPGGASLVWGDRDYLITAAALAAAGISGPPQRGDRVAEGALTFELEAPSTGEPCWRYSDHERTRYRLHVKRVG